LKQEPAGNREELLLQPTKRVGIRRIHPSGGRQDDLVGRRSWGELHVRVVEHALHHREPSRVGARLVQGLRAVPLVRVFAEHPAEGSLTWAV
jgi:hypothetical protein